MLFVFRHQSYGHFIKFKMGFKSNTLRTARLDSPGIRSHSSFFFFKKKEV